MRKLSSLILICTLGLIGSVTTIRLSTQTVGPLPSGTYRTVLRGFCTGTVASSDSAVYTIAGFGGIVTTCAGTATTAASGTKVTGSGTIKNLYLNSSAAGKNGDKIQILKNGATTGAPTCTWGTATTCNDTSSSLSVVAGDVITLSITTGTSDGSANLAVTFDFWN